MADIVSLRRCESYDENAVNAAVAKAVADIGGFAPYIAPGERVLLKANLVMRKKPEEAATTHPAIMKALATLLIAYGCSVVIGDSPGGPFNEAALKGIYESTGMRRVAEETGAALNTNIKSRVRANPPGLLLKQITMADMLNDVDKVISVAKLKTHGMMAYTGAAKNMFGTIPGVAKAEYHMSKPTHKNFADALIDICLCANPVLSFIDGIVGMEGAGPTSGVPRALGVVLAAANPFAADKTACRIIGLSEANVPLLAQAVKRGLCGAGMSALDLRGDPIESFSVPDFNIPQTHAILGLSRLPKPIRRFTEANLSPRPVFDHAACIGCGDCAKNCPAKVIAMRERKPYVTPDGCIRCFCCQELCPKKAVSAYRPALLRLLRK